MDNDRIFRILLDLFMISDPWPFEQGHHDELEAFLTEAAQDRGYESWTVAYHEFVVPDIHTVKAQRQEQSDG